MDIPEIENRSALKSWMEIFVADQYV